MGKGSGSQTSTTQQSNAPNPQAMADYQSTINQAQAAANRPLQQYTGNMVAGFTPMQQNAFNTIDQAQGMALPYINSAAQMVGAATQPISPMQFSGNAVNNYMSPFTQDVVNSTMANINETNQEQQTQLQGNAIAQGAFGGDRAGVAAAELARQQGLANNQTLAGLENQAYTQALGEFNTQQQTGVGAQEASQWLASNAGFELGNLGQLAQSTTTAGAAGELSAGTLQQQLAQEQLNIPYEQFVQQQAYPFQTAQYMAGIDSGLGSLMGGSASGTQTTPGPSEGQQVIGDVLGAAGIAAMFMSDPALKHSSGPSRDGLGTIRSLGVEDARYKWDAPGTERPMLMADNVQQVRPDMVHGPDGMRGIQPYKLIPTMIEAIKELDKRTSHAVGGAVRRGYDLGGATGSMALPPVPGMSSGVPDPSQASIVPTVSMGGGRGPGLPNATFAPPQQQQPSGLQQALPFMAMMNRNRNQNQQNGGIGGYMGSGLSESDMNTLDEQAQANIAGMAGGDMGAYASGGRAGFSGGGKGGTVVPSNNVPVNMGGRGAPVAPPIAAQTPGQMASMVGQIPAVNMPISGQGMPTPPTPMPNGFIQSYFPSAGRGIPIPQATPNQPMARDSNGNVPIQPMFTWAPPPVSNSPGLGNTTFTPPQPAPDFNSQVMQLTGAMPHLAGGGRTPLKTGGGWLPIVEDAAGSLIPANLAANAVAKNGGSDGEAMAAAFGAGGLGLYGTGRANGSISTHSALPLGLASGLGAAGALGMGYMFPNGIAGARGGRIGYDVGGTVLHAMDPVHAMPPPTAVPQQAMRPMPGQAMPIPGMPGAGLMPGGGLKRSGGRIGYDDGGDVYLPGEGSINEPGPPIQGPPMPPPQAVPNPETPETRLPAGYESPLQRGISAAKSHIPSFSGAKMSEPGQESGAAAFLTGQELGTPQPSNPAMTFQPPFTPNTPPASGTSVPPPTHITTPDTYVPGVIPRSPDWSRYSEANGTGPATMYRPPSYRPLPGPPPSKPEVPQAETNGMPNDPSWRLMENDALAKKQQAQAQTPAQPQAAERKSAYPARSPWEMLAAIGAGMAASKSPHFGVALGEGLQQGLATMERGRAEELKEYNSEKQAQQFGEHLALTRKQLDVQSDYHRENMQRLQDAAHERTQNYAQNAQFHHEDAQARIAEMAAAQASAAADRKQRQDLANQEARQGTLYGYHTGDDGKTYGVFRDKLGHESIGTTPITPKEQERSDASKAATPYQRAELISKLQANDPTLSDEDAGARADKMLGHESAILSAPPPNDQRVKDKVYQTPKGPMKWNGQSWEPAQ